MGTTLEEESLSYLKPPKLRHDYLLGLVFVLMAGILVVGWLPKVFYFNLATDTYLTLHMLLMFFSVVVSITVFVVGWYDYKQTRSIRELILCLTFFMVGLIDVAHTLSYEGLPNFFTDNTLNKSTSFWVASRFIESVGICLAVVLKPTKKQVNSLAALFGVFIITCLFIGSILYQVPGFLELYTPGMGQTKVKVFLDYLVMFIKGVALYHLIKMNRNYMADYYLQAALIFGIFSEAAFTLYSAPYDTYNMLGHVYKLFEFGFIMKALFVLSVVRLYQINTVLHNQKRRMAEINIELEKANRLKSEFLTNTNHELRTPLTAIIAFTEFLRDEETGPLTRLQRDYINEINESSQQLLIYINNLLDISKIEAGKMELRREMVSVGEIFEKVYKKMLPLFRMKNQRVKLSIDENIPMLNVDPVKIGTVLTNLLSNAYKFAPEEGQIEIKARLDKNKNEVIITVSDNGIGVSDEDQRMIFQRFKQVNEATTLVHPGTGLGLALVKVIVQLHGGSVEVKSKLGEGSSFSFSIPLSEEEKNEQL